MSPNTESEMAVCLWRDTQLSSKSNHSGEIRLKPETMTGPMRLSDKEQNLGFKNWS